jgi:hypothetical protein
VFVAHRRHLHAPEGDGVRETYRRERRSATANRHGAPLPPPPGWRSPTPIGWSLGTIHDERPQEAHVAVTEEVQQDRPGTGWMAFAGAMLVVGGGFKIVDAVYAFKYDDEISEQLQTIIFEGDPAAWGWLWLITGVVLIAAGFSVVAGASWARWVGIIAAIIVALVSYLWIFVEPIWGLVNVALAIMVIYALVNYGGRRDLYT